MSAPLERSGVYIDAISVSTRSSCLGFRSTVDVSLFVESPGKPGRWVKGHTTFWKWPWRKTPNTNIGELVQEAKKIGLPMIGNDKVAVKP